MRPKIDFVLLCLNICFGYISLLIFISLDSGNYDPDAILPMLSLVFLFGLSFGWTVLLLILEPKKKRGPKVKKFFDGCDLR